MKCKHLKLFLLIIPFIAGCVSVQVIDEPTHEPQAFQVLLEQLERIEDPFVGLLLGIGHVQSPGFHEQFDNYQELFLTFIQNSFQSLLDAGDMRSLDIYNNFGDAYQLPVPELVSQVTELFSLSPLPNEQKSLWANRIVQQFGFQGSQNNSSLNAISYEDLEFITDQAHLLKHRDLKDLFQLPHQGFIPSEALQAVVTVLVDQGIQMTRGIGRPNIVVGSGFFIDPDGYILTNYHVIQSQVDPSYQGVSRLTVRLYSSDGRAVAQRVPARVVGYDELLDIALLKTETIPPGIISLGSMASIQPGAEVLAIGSPGGLENTLTRGIVSAMGRRFLQIGEVFQVDIPLNPGNSGGPVFDRSGRVVGVVFAGIQQFDGVNFIIPSDRIMQILPQLFTPGQISHPWIGTSVHEIARGLSVSFISPQSITRSSALRPGDIIRSINGLPVRTIPQAQSLISQHEVGSFITFEVERNGNTFFMPIPVEPRPVFPMAEILGQTLASRWLLPLFGMNVSRLDNRGGRPTFQVTRVFPGSVAAESGITELDSFSLLRWIYDEEQRVAAIQIMIERKNSGMMPEGLQLAVFIGLSNFL